MQPMLLAYAELNWARAYQHVEADLVLHLHLVCANAYEVNYCKQPQAAATDYAVAYYAERKRSGDFQTIENHCNQVGARWGEMLEGTWTAGLGCGIDGTVAVAAIRHDGRACSLMPVRQSSQWTYWA